MSYYSLGGQSGVRPTNHIHIRRDMNRRRGGNCRPSHHAETIRISTNRRLGLGLSLASLSLKTHRALQLHDLIDGRVHATRVTALEWKHEVVDVLLAPHDLINVIHTNRPSTTLDASLQEVPHGTHQHLA